jgi:hypothetical protein
MFSEKLLVLAIRDLTPIPFSAAHITDNRVNTVVMRVCNNRGISRSAISLFCAEHEHVKYSATVFAFKPK